MLQQLDKGRTSCCWTARPLPISRRRRQAPNTATASRCRPMLARSTSPPGSARYRTARYRILSTGRGGLNLPPYLCEVVAIAAKD